MENRKAIFISAFIGALISFVLIVCIACIIMSFEFDTMHIEEQFMLGGTPLADDVYRAIIIPFNATLALDTVMIMGEILVLIGLFYLVKEKNPTAGRIVLGCGLAGAFLDFIQNAIEWSFFRGMTLGMKAEPVWYFSWSVSTVLSYIMMFTAGFILVMILSQKKLIVILPASVFTAAAVAGTFIRSLYIISFAWYVVFFGTAAILFFRTIREKQGSNN
jgi:hypothetical protein